MFNVKFTFFKFFIRKLLKDLFRIFIFMTNPSKRRISVNDVIIISCINIFNIIVRIIFNILNIIGISYGIRTHVSGMKTRCPEPDQTKETHYKLAAPPGLEPRIVGPKPTVLPITPQGFIFNYFIDKLTRYKQQIRRNVNNKIM